MKNACLWVLFFFRILNFKTFFPTLHKSQGYELSLIPIIIVLYEDNSLSILLVGSSFFLHKILFPLFFHQHFLRKQNFNMTISPMVTWFKLIVITLLCWSYESFNMCVSCAFMIVLTFSQRGTCQYSTYITIRICIGRFYDTIFSLCWLWIPLHSPKYMLVQ